MNRRIRKKVARRLWGRAARHIAAGTAYAGAANYGRLLRDPVADVVAAEADSHAREEMGTALTLFARAIKLTSRKRPYQRITISEMRGWTAQSDGPPFTISFE